MTGVARVMKTMKKILVIDDDAELRQLLATYLGRHGFSPPATKPPIGCLA